MECLVSIAKILVRLVDKARQNSQDSLAISAELHHRHGTRSVRSNIVNIIEPDVQTQGPIPTSSNLGVCSSFNVCQKSGALGD